MKDVLKSRGFIATVHYHSDDDLFHGKIEGIDDSITFEGDSVSELKKEFEEAINDYLEICKEIGKDPHKSFKGSFNIRIKPELHKKATHRSVEMGISLNQFVEKAIKKFLTGKSGQLT